MHLRIPRRPAAVSLLLVLALAGLLLAGCGSSSSNTVTTSASATAAGGAGGTGTTGAGGTGATGTTGARGAGRFTAIRECLQKAGITLPSRPQGTRPQGGGGGGFFGGGSGAGPALPKGVTREQFQAALKKCGLSRRPGAGGRFGAGRANLNTPAFRKTLASFSACMNEHGVKLPAPNTSGKGPVFDTTGINTKSAAFQKAEETCRGKVHLFFPGAGGSGSAGGAPPSAAAPPGEGGVPPAGTPPAE